MLAFVEIGEYDYDGNRYEFEGDALLYVTSEGTVYARVGELKDIPAKEY